MKSGNYHLLSDIKYRLKSNYASAFTIVELLVVIVVIGILAAITIVSYGGVTGRATIVSLQSDLTNASQQLKMYQVTNSAYPTAIDCSATPAANTICLKSSGSNTYNTIRVNNNTDPQTFCLAASNGNSEHYATDNANPTTGVCINSCLDILNSGGSTGDGVYWINPAGYPLQVYCDMTISGGGWTLILTNPGPYTAWNTTNVRSLNSNSPSISALYSILDRADSVKSNIGGNLQYRIDAVSFGHWGGVWQAPFTNTFVGTSVVNNSTNMQQYDTWTIDTTPNDTTSLSNIMPWIGNSTQLLSTWSNAGSWWGTLVTGSSGWTPAPYITPEKGSPGIIWYWVK